MWGSRWDWLEKFEINKNGKEIVCKILNFLWKFAISFASCNCWPRKNVFDRKLAESSRCFFYEFCGSDVSLVVQYNWLQIIWADEALDVGDSKSILRMPVKFYDFVFHGKSEGYLAHTAKKITKKLSPPEIIFESVPYLEDLFFFVAQPSGSYRSSSFPRTVKLDFDTRTSLISISGRGLRFERYDLSPNHSGAFFQPS